MKLAQPEVGTLLVAILTKQTHDLPLANHVVNLLSRAGGRTCRFTFGSFAIQATSFHEILHGLLKRPLTRMEVYINADTCGPVTRKAQNLSLRWRVVWIKACAHQHLFTVKRPAFDKDAVGVLPANLV